jgi:hypothetical protein
MTVPMLGQVPAQPMSPATRRQILLRLKKIHNRVQLVQILPLLSRAAEVFLESGCR